jgi:hypothetical protein
MPSSSGKWECTNHPYLKLKAKLKDSARTDRVESILKAWTLRLVSDHGAQLR